MRHTRRTLLCASLGGLGSALAGCIGADGGAGDRETETETTTRTTATTAGQSAFPDYNWGQLEGVSPTETTEIVQRDTAFNPLVALVTRGTEVTYLNEDSFGHTVTIPALDVDKQLGGGQSVAVTFDRAGTFDYVCTLHPPDMLGRVIVQTVGQSEFPDYTWEQLEGVSPTETTEVVQRNVAFDPLVTQVTRGTEVTFVNEDSFGHTVTVPALGVDEQLGSGQSVAVTFDRAGTFDYVCTLHPPDMLGRIVVTEEEAAETTTQPTTEMTETTTETTTEERETTTTEGGGDGGYY